MAGDVADAMLDGTLCEICGEFLDDGDPVGYPVRCSGCKKEHGAVPLDVKHPQKAMVLCPVCHKRVKEVGLGRHVKDAHSASQKVMKYNHRVRGNTPGGS